MILTSIRAPGIDLASLVRVIRLAETRTASPAVWPDAVLLDGGHRRSERSGVWVRNRGRAYGIDWAWAFAIAALLACRLATQPARIRTIPPARLTQRP